MVRRFKALRRRADSRKSYTKRCYVLTFEGDASKVNGPVVFLDDALTDPEP